MGTPPDRKHILSSEDYYDPSSHQQSSSFQIPIPTDYLYQQQSQERYLDYQQSVTFDRCFAFQNPINHAVVTVSQNTAPGDAVASISSRNSDSFSGISEMTTLIAPTEDGVAVSSIVPEAREKSKNAARIRRMNENHEYKILTHMLPLPVSAKVMLDKASVIRLTTNFLELRKLFSSSKLMFLNVVAHIRKSFQQANASLFFLLVDSKEGGINEPQSSLSSYSDGMLETLDGFLLILSNSHSVTYIGDTVKTLLGLAKWDLTGTKFISIVKEEDQEELDNLLRLSSLEMRQISRLNPEARFERRFTVRVKCILSKRNSGLVSEGYKALHFGGHITARLSHEKEGSKKVIQQLYGVASTLPAINWNSTEIKMGRDMFMLRTSLALGVAYADEQLQVLTGYQARDIIDTSLYQLIHVEDAEELAECHATCKTIAPFSKGRDKRLTNFTLPFAVLTKGQVITRYFRLLCKYGGWVWVQMHAIRIRTARGSKSDCVVAIAYVLTRSQLSNMKFDIKQLQGCSFGTLNYERALISRPVNHCGRKRSHPSQLASQVQTSHYQTSFPSKLSAYNANFYRNLNGGVEGGGENVIRIYPPCSMPYRSLVHPNQQGLANDAYDNPNGLLVQQPTEVPGSAPNWGTVGEHPHYGVPFSGSSVPPSSIPSSFGSSSYLEQLRNYQTDVNFADCWQDTIYSHQN
ncbi:unnamed protein product [Hydatigera taeniaeformis]|uniref:PAS domain-containing protein n=1 Tax=Hydatigena taeniaeformis TaxID=6205 RepID=A0A0R3WIF3_HYDTA|nr:unnamed protein product [Hydatigera taeniaeformis]